MAEQPASHESADYVPVKPLDIEQVNLSMKVIAANDRKIADALANESSANASTAMLRAAVVDPLQGDNDKRLAGIREFLLANEDAIKAERGKTIHLDVGDIKWFVRERVDLPADTEPVVRFFLNRHFGRRYLIQKWAPNKGAIRNAHRRLKNILRNDFGVFIGDVKHLTLSIKTREKPIELHEERLSKRQPRVTR